MAGTSSHGAPRMLQAGPRLCMPTSRARRPPRWPTKRGITTRLGSTAAWQRCWATFNVYNWTATLETMPSITVGFSIPKEDESRLEHLVERFGHGNRSAFLRTAMKHMEVLERAEHLDQLADYGAERLAAKQLAPEDIPALVKKVLAQPAKR